MAKNELKLNREIRAPEVRLIDQNGNMVGIVPTTEALKMAFETGLDLVEISPNVKPPVVRIVSYSKMKYEEQKRANLNKKKQKTSDIKEIKLSMNIGEGDMVTKIKQAIKFIENGDKVKFNFMFKGREITHTDMVQNTIDRIINDMKDIAKLESKPQLEGKKMFFTMVPIK